MSLSRLRFALSLAALLAVMAGCVPIPPVATVAPTPVVTLEQCFTAGPGEKSHTDPTGGYCLLYPGDYKFQETGVETNFFFESMMDVSHPKLFVKVADANGQTAAQIADALIAEVEAAGLKDQIVRAPQVELGSEPAVRLDNVPGQDLGRVLIAVHGPRAYRLTFVPDDYATIEALYNLVVKTFRFLP